MRKILSAVIAAVCVLAPTLASWASPVRIIHGGRPAPGGRVYASAPISSPEALTLLASNVFAQADGSTLRWRNITITYRIEGGDEALARGTEEGAAFWNANAGGVFTLVRTEDKYADIVVRIASREEVPPGRCGIASYQPDLGAIISAKISVLPSCVSALSLAHEFGHAIGITGHTETGVMSHDTNPGYALAEGPNGLFEALRILYANPPGSRFVAPHIVP